MNKASALQSSLLNEFAIVIQKKVNLKLKSMQKLRFWEKEKNVKGLKLCFEAIKTNDDHHKKKMNIFFVCDEPTLAERAVNIIHKELEEIRPKVREPHHFFISTSPQGMERKGVRIYALLGLVMNHIEKLYQGIFNKMWDEIRYTLNDNDAVFKNIFISADPPEVYAHLPEDLHSIFYQRKRNYSTDTLLSLSLSGSYIDENNNIIDAKAEEKSPVIARPLAPVY